ncbi:CapA family protein [uncultured Pontibacter sp.]|uniref:CapA family protein n=1 Tax=uncultured Pontibacter sp. TaxID=453356 RepID=UPI0026224B07|nr:CapA family protein [uncultured Pontibacter sp.]
MKIALLGDIAFFGKFCLAENQNIKTYFQEAAFLLNKYDYVIGNLETPFADNCKPHGAKSAFIKANPINVELLKYLNISIVNLANNHIYDFGSAGYKLTKDILEKNNIQYFGIEGRGINIDDKSGKIALSGYCCYSTNPIGIDEGSGHGINPLNVSVVKEKMIANQKAGFYNIVSVHCGEEHVNLPNRNHLMMARQLAEVSPYTFYGHHPHVMQGIEKIKDSLIAYSLGNFCFDDVYTSKSKEPLIKQNDNNKSSFILELEVINDRLISYKPIPIYASDNTLIIGQESILNQINKYSQNLKIEKDEYENKRNEILSKYIQSRKSLRNFNWYFKRLNYQSFLILKAARVNAQKFKNNVLDYLN